ncbi:MAG: DAK2 domain-containing protein [Anaerolineae bacterium]|nr:DAK2 domain-containing protein [Anaerolineae bacterium]
MASGTSGSNIRGFEIESGVAMRGDGAGLRNIFRAGLRWLELHVQDVNNLNVFPIPDGDTGTNMFLTLQAALSAVPADEDHAGTVAEALAQGALMGGRGNSGVILSQFIQGMAAGLADKATFEAFDLVRAWRLGSEHAYKSVVEPVEGTILTIARCAAEAAEAWDQQPRDLVALFETVTSAVRTAQAETPNYLTVLREAGVTDSGGQGLVYIFEGGLRFLRHEPLDLPDQISAPAVSSEPAFRQPESALYDIQFLIEGDGLAVEAIRAGITPMGESPLVVGTDSMVRVHLHGTDPAKPLRFGAEFGAVSQASVENMARQSRDAVKPIGIVAVVSDLGFVAIFQQESVVLVQPVSFERLFEVIHHMQARQVFVLPNDDDVMILAQAVREHCQKSVYVVSTRAIPQGIAALLAFNDTLAFEENARRMGDAARRVRTLEVLDSSLCGNGNGTVSTGVTTLYEGDLLVAGQDLIATTLLALECVEAEQYELITLYSGQHSRPAQTQVLKNEIAFRYPEADVEIYLGEYGRYHYIISLE